MWKEQSDWFHITLHMITSKGESQKKNGYWKHKNKFLSWSFFDQVDEDWDGKYWNECYWLVLNFSNLPTQSKILWERNERAFFLKSRKWTYINSPFKVAKGENYKVRILNLSNSLKLPGAGLLTTKRFGLNVFVNSCFFSKMKSFIILGLKWWIWFKNFIWDTPEREG